MNNDQRHFDVHIFTKDDSSFYKLMYVYLRTNIRQHLMKLVITTTYIDYEFHTYEL
jgi:hypothetical protein